MYFDTAFNLKNVATNAYLHSHQLPQTMLAAEKRMAHQYVESILELNGSTHQPTLFQATPFRLWAEHTADLHQKETAVWGGAVFTLYHTEIEADLVASKSSSYATEVYFEKPPLTADHKTKIDSKALWRVELASPRALGGKVFSNRPVRLKHCVSHEYLLLLDGSSYCLVHAGVMTELWVLGTVTTTSNYNEPNCTWLLRSFGALEVRWGLCE